MFYSNTFLARKSPLGTVWIAAFLQHKLRKSQVAIIDISASVDRIMFPEVPIALRLSGHLLVGVVRIYSKKVDYLYHDCTEVWTQIRTAFASIQVNLPEGASHAPFESITRPETFELDALDINEAISQSEAPDTHFKSIEEITLPDHISLEGNSYIAINIEEDEVEPPLTERFEPADGDIFQPLAEAFNADPRNPHDNGPELHEGFQESPPIEEVPEAERRRDAVQTFEPLLEDAVGPGSGLDHNDLVDPMPNKGTQSPISQGIAVEGSESMPSMPRGVPSTVISDERLEASSLRRPASLELALVPTPPQEKQKPQLRKRKRLFDESLVLTNEEMKLQLEDSKKLLRKRRRTPLTTLGVWKKHRRSDLDQVFSEPSVTGMCTSLQEVFRKAFPVSSEPDSNHVEALSVANNLQAPGDIDVPQMEIGVLQAHVGEVMPDMGSPPERDGLPVFSGPPSGHVLETEVVYSPFTGTVDQAAATPRVNLEEQFPLQNPTFSEFILNSADSDELSFLDADSRQTGYDTSGIDSLSTRTRATAQYLIRKSPASLVSKSHSGEISLDGILQGETRQKCARMFFETLVLKCYGFIDVQQDEAYGDIKLLVTSSLLNAEL